MLTASEKNIKRFGELAEANEVVNEQYVKYMADEIPFGDAAMNVIDDLVEQGIETQWIRPTDFGCIFNNSDNYEYHGHGNPYRNLVSWNQLKVDEVADGTLIFTNTPFLSLPQITWENHERRIMTETLLGADNEYIGIGKSATFYSCGEKTTPHQVLACNVKEVVNIS